MAHRYGCLPTEIMSQDVDEFSLNLMILYTGIEYENSVKTGKPIVLDNGDTSAATVSKNVRSILSRRSK